ncbi:MAG: nuclear transport factor 2 family protein, partial [Deltaproteobacteria bacterium]|nr:nuclear transport factor 2 family protein [Deltaproteobacteria bacterium]
MMVIAEDKVDVMNLISLHSHAMDGTDPQAYAEVFTTDGIYLERRQDRERVLGQGREGLTEYISRLIKERGDNQPRHHVRNTIFLKISEDSMTTHTYFLVNNVPGAGQLARVVDTGIY